MPDVICSQVYADKLNEDYLKNPSSELKRKVECTRRLLSSSTANITRHAPRKLPVKRSLSLPPANKVKKRGISPENEKMENENLKCQVERLKKELEEKGSYIESLQEQLTKAQTELEKNAEYFNQQMSLRTVPTNTEVFLCGF